MRKEHNFRQLMERMYGGLGLSWLAVVIYAVATAVITTVFLVIPVFENTSFERMGVHLEAWIFFAVIILANCEKPLEAAEKTFVFFLVSQPLIYLFQVPFSEQGWGLFGYYKYWFVWTICTFPMAFVGWYIRKKNWLSLLILAPVLIYLTGVYLESFRFSAAHFPYRLVTAIFCLVQVLLYLYVFTEKISQRLLGFLIPFLPAALLLVSGLKVEVNGSYFLPDNPVLSEDAVLSVEEGPAEMSLEADGADSMVRIQSKEYGTTGFVITDQGREYRYSVTIYEDEQGSVQVQIDPRTEAGMP